MRQRTLIKALLIGLLSVSVIGGMASCGGGTEQGVNNEEIHSSSPTTSLPSDDNGSNEEQEPNLPEDFESSSDEETSGAPTTSNDEFEEEEEPDSSETPDDSTGAEEEPTQPEPVTPPEADSELTIVEALAYAATFENMTSSENRYYVRGTITSIMGADGSMYIEDESGNRIYVVSVSSADGSTSFQFMENPMQVGDEVKLYAWIGKLHNELSIIGAWAVEVIEKALPIGLPNANSEVSIVEANLIGSVYQYGGRPKNKYYVTGRITEIRNNVLGIFYVTDEEGNRLRISGAFNYNGTVRYGKMENPPQIGDKVKLYGVIGYYEESEMQEAWIKKVIIEEPQEPEGPFTILKNYLKTNGETEDQLSYMCVLGMEQNGSAMNLRQLIYDATLNTISLFVTSTNMTTGAVQTVMVEFNEQLNGMYTWTYYDVMTNRMLLGMNNMNAATFNANTVLDYTMETVGDANLIASLQQEASQSIHNMLTLFADDCAKLGITMAQLGFVNYNKTA